MAAVAISKTISYQRTKAVMHRYEDQDNLRTEFPPLRDRDNALTADLEETLASHVLLRDQKLRFAVRGGVVHLRGEVPSPRIRRIVRSAIGRIRGIHALWDTLTVPGEDALMVLDLGCGGRKQISWAMGIDKFPHQGVDIVADMEQGLPLADDQADHIFAVHALEHVRNLVFLMNEIHRCLKPGGVLHVMVPASTSHNAIADPTHVRIFHRQSFKYFCTPKPEVRLYRPLIVSEDRDNILADLEPVKGGIIPATPHELAAYFE